MYLIHSMKIRELMMIDRKRIGRVVVGNETKLKALGYVCIYIEFAHTDAHTWMEEECGQLTLESYGIRIQL